MADYFLDTDVCLVLINGTSSEVRERFRRADAEGSSISVSTVVLYELWYGVEKSARREFNTERLETFLSGPFEIVDFDADDAKVAGAVRAELVRSGQPIGAYDVLIAGQAKRHGATLVTSNISEFSRVRELLVEDWSRPAPE
jgi:tRNA(fMet)-specific endonuclease VapC